MSKLLEAAKAYMHCLDSCKDETEAEQAMRDAIAEAEQQKCEQAEFELHQDDAVVAGSFGPRADAWREIQHYAAQYSQDGTVEIYEVIRRKVEQPPVNLLSIGK